MTNIFHIKNPKEGNLNEIKGGNPKERNPKRGNPKEIQTKFIEIFI